MPGNGQNSAPIFPCRFSKVETDEPPAIIFDLLCPRSYYNIANADRT